MYNNTVYLTTNNKYKMMMKDLIDKGDVELLKVIKRIMCKHIPDLYKLTNLKDQVIIKSFKKYLNRVKNIENKDEFIIGKQHCLYEYLVFAESGVDGSISFLKYINEQCKYLYENVEENLRPAIVHTFKEIMTQVRSNVEDSDDNYINNATFLNFIGEVLIASEIIAEGAKLIDIERVLPNKKSVDFVFLKDGLERYIEVRNIQDINIEKIVEPLDLRNFLKEVYNNKIQDKTENLEYDGINILFENKIYSPFEIASICWAEAKELVGLSSEFRTMDNDFMNVMPCLAVVPEKDENGKLHYSLRPISEIIQYWEEELK